jgi:hypothetical protein
MVVWGSLLWMISHHCGIARLTPYSQMIIPDIRLHTDDGMPINDVLTLSKKVNTKIHTMMDQMMRSGLYLSVVARLLPNMTGMTGNTHGARTESIHEKNEIIMSSIVLWLSIKKDSPIDLIEESRN